jgi:hypothetical protein
MPLYFEPDPCLKLSSPSIIVPPPATQEKRECADE